MLLAYLQGRTNALGPETRADPYTRSAGRAETVLCGRVCIEMIHGLPERTPLNPVTVRVVERDGYRIESLMFESRPNFW